MDPRSAYASILQRGAGQRGRHGAPGADTGRRLGAGDGGRKESPSTGEAPERGDAGTSPAAVTPGDGKSAGPARLREGEGKGPGREEGAGRRPARQESRRAQSLASERQRPGQAQGRERGPGGSTPPHRGAHGGRGLSTARQAQPPPARPGRALSNSRGRLARSRKPSSSSSLFFFFSSYCSCCPRPTAAAPRGCRSPGPPPSRFRVAPGGQDRARPPGDASALNGDGGSPNRHTVRGGGGAAPSATPHPSPGRASSPPPIAGGGGRARRARGTMGAVVSSGRAAPEEPPVDSPGMGGREGARKGGKGRERRRRISVCAEGQGADVLWGSSSCAAAPSSTRSAGQKAPGVLALLVSSSLVLHPDVKYFGCMYLFRCCL